MKRKFSPLFSVVASLAFLTAPASFAQNTNDLSTAASAVDVNTAIVPEPRDTNWVARHEGFVAQAKKGGVDLLFLGDSITDGWRGRGSNVWNKFYAPHHAANFGISGDRTQHVLWRIDHGELDGINPKVTVLMIGTNNSKDNSAGQIAAGIRLILDEILAKCPGTKVLLLGVFPRNTKKDVPAQMETIHQVNALIAGFDDGKTVKYLDIGPKFLGADGQVPAAIMPDFLHPNAQGYQIWAEAMEPALAPMMK